MTDHNKSRFYEKIREKKKVFSGKIFFVERAEVELIDGKTAMREIVHHNGGACILALDYAENIYLVNQYRISAEQDLLEIPAGKLEKGENYLDCAKRELREELGITAKNWDLLSEFYPTPGYCSEKIQIFLARDLTFGDRQLDAGEFLESKTVSLKEALKMIDDKRILDAKTMLAVLLTDQLLKKGFERA